MLIHLYKMYYLSDKGRLSVFLHAEKREQFFDNLKTFCLEHDPDFQSTLVRN